MCVRVAAIFVGLCGDAGGTVVLRVLVFCVCMCVCVCCFFFWWWAWACLLLVTVFSVFVARRSELLCVGSQRSAREKQVVPVEACFFSFSCFVFLCAAMFHVLAVSYSPGRFFLFRKTTFYKVFHVLHLSYLAEWG